MKGISTVAALASLIGSVGLLFGSPAAAQQVLNTPPATAKPPSAEPDTTSATFGDWTLRCDRRLDVTPPQRFCELAHIVQKAGETAAQGQLAVGRVSRSEPLKITAVLPINVALRTLPKLVAEGPEPVSLDLVWSRCIVGACFADAVAPDEVVKRLRSRTEPGRVEYRDGTDREATLPISFRGFGQALDALAREPAN